MYHISHRKGETGGMGLLLKVFSYGDPVDIVKMLVVAMILLSNGHYHFLHNQGFHFQKETLLLLSFINKEELLMSYVVCQKPKCQQRYPIEYFRSILRDTKPVKCEKCCTVLIEKDGRINALQDATIRSIHTMAKLEALRLEEIKEKRKELYQLKKEIEALTAITL